MRMQFDVCDVMRSLWKYVARLCLYRWFVMKVGAAEQDQCSVMNHSCCTVLANTESRVGAGTVEWLFTLSLYSVQYFSHSPLSYSHFLWLIAEWLRAAKLSLPMVPDFSHMTESHTWRSVFSPAFFSLLCLSFSLALHHALPAFLFHAPSSSLVPLVFLLPDGWALGVCGANVVLAC